MRILMVGDVIGKPGRRAIKTLIPALRQEHGIDLVIANGENTAGGFGLTWDTACELLENGVDVLTSGNHIWDQKEIIPYLEEGLPLVRPANYPDAPAEALAILIRRELNRCQSIILPDYALSSACLVRYK